MDKAREFLRQFTEIEYYCKNLYDSINIRNPNGGYDRSPYCKELLTYVYLISERKIDESRYEDFMSFGVNGILIHLKPEDRKKVINNILENIKE